MVFGADSIEHWNQEKVESHPTSHELPSQSLQSMVCLFLLLSESRLGTCLGVAIVHCHQTFPETFAKFSQNICWPLNYGLKPCQTFSESYLGHSGIRVKISKAQIDADGDGSCHAMPAMIVNAFFNTQPQDFARRPPFSPNIPASFH